MASITEHIDRVTLIPQSYLKAVLPAPRAVKIEISGRCNYRCGFCALRTRESQPKEDMSFSFFTRVADQMREAGVEELGLFYLGESFMNPSALVDCIHYAKKELEFPYVFLTSNASLAYPEIVNACMASGLDSLKWSVNASDASQFSKVMGVSSRFYTQSLHHIRSAWKIREAESYQTGLYASSILYDDKQKKAMQPVLETSILPFVDEHYWLPLYSMGSFATEREKVLGYRPIAGNQGRLDKLRNPLPCWSVFTEAHITTEGHLSACCFDATNHWSMGNLHEMSFMQAWNAPQFVSLRQAHLEQNIKGTVCENCMAYD
jgi:radical SAM protein with 4Fe4S-binding SPASM domain